MCVLLPGLPSHQWLSCKSRIRRQVGTVKSTVFLVGLFAVSFCSAVGAQDAYLGITTIKNTDLARANLLEAFGKKTSLAIKDAPIKDPLKLIAETHDLTIKTDQYGLASMMERSNLTVKDRPLSEVLRKLLKPLDLTYLVRGHTLVITTARVAASQPRAKVISLPPGLRQDKQAIAKALSWFLAVEKPGTRPSTIEAVTVVGDSLRVVGHARSFHKVEAFLEDLSRVREKEERSKASD